VGSTPFGEMIVATNGAVIVMIDPAEVPEKTRTVIKNTINLNEDRPAVMAVFEPLTRPGALVDFPDGISFKTVVSECKRCKGHPLNRILCRECFGAGKNKELKPKAVKMFENRYFASEHLKPILALADLQRYKYQGEQRDSPLAFRFKATGRGLIMPCRDETSTRVKA
jgi:hypothetical protein